MIDPIQKEAIVKLNQHGMAAAMIARILGLEPSSVRSHLARNPHQRSRNQGMEDGRWCRWCGNPIATQATGRPASFCCSEHRRAWWAAHPEAKTVMPPIPSPVSAVAPRSPRMGISIDAIAAMNAT